MAERDLTDIRLERIGIGASPERISASYVEEGNTAAVLILAGILVIALAVGYVGYCFYTTAEMITQRDALMKAPPPKLKR